MSWDLFLMKNLLKSDICDPWTVYECTVHGWKVNLCGWRKKKKKRAETRIATHVNAANTDPNRRFETKNVYQNKTKKKKVKKCKNIWEREVCSTLHRSYVLLVFLSASARSIPFSPFFDLPKTVSSCFFTWPLNPRRQCQKTT